MMLFLLRPSVDVTDANVCYSFQVFQSLICKWHACLYPSVFVTFVLSVFKSFAIMFQKVLLQDGKHTLLQIKYI